MFLVGSGEATPLVGGRRGMGTLVGAGSEPPPHALVVRALAGTELLRDTSGRCRTLVRYTELEGDMKLDLLYEIDVPKPWPGPHPYGQRAAEQKAYREAMEQIKLADELGFHTTWHVEHHFREGRSHSPAPEVILGALSQVTHNLRLGFGVTLMPHAFTPPMRVAEKVATVDILSGGRVEWGTGRSTPMEQTAFGVPRAESRDQWEEAIEAVVQMWESEYFEFHGKYLDFPRRVITPKPVQDPHPPCWMAATTGGSAAVAGSKGLGLLSFSILQPLEAMADQIRQYRE